MTAELASQDFQLILSSPILSYQEGMSFFKGEGLMNKSLQQLAADLNRKNIKYAVIGGIALNQHGYQRFTQDIDILLTKEGLQSFEDNLVGLGYVPAFLGAKKKFRTTEENVPVEIITTGEFPGDGKEKPVVFPDPSSDGVAIEISGINTLTLNKLIELKLASGMTGAGRRKDLADVQELIKIKGLKRELGDELMQYVRAMYFELWDEI